MFMLYVQILHDIAFLLILDLSCLPFTYYSSIAFL